MSRIAVIGAGVSGLTSGIVLAESGYDVTLFAAELVAKTSSVAAAIWFPYHVDIRPKKKAERLAQYSYDVFELLARDPGSGVKMIEFCYFSKKETTLDFPAWSDGRKRRDLTREEIPAAYKSGYAVTVPLMQTPLYLPYLRRRFRRAGGRIRQKTIDSLHDLTPRFDAVVNCSGYGAKMLCKKDLRLKPGRGVVVRTPNPGIDRALVYIEEENAMMYVIPRQNDCVLGGCDDEDESTAVDPALARAIYERCRLIENTLPEMVEPGEAGIRPIRSPVRLELKRLDGTPVVHNYGHGGAGFTVSWGCAREVLRKVDRALRRPR
jgi:D-amino-acid oxidase